MIADVSRPPEYASTIFSFAMMISSLNFKPLLQGVLFE